MKTPQEIFDHIVLSLRKQGKPSIIFVEDGMTECCYRNGDYRCAGGWVIPDDIYHPSFEGGDWISLMENQKILDLYNEKIHNIICDLQSAHDCDDIPKKDERDAILINPELWLYHFLKIAKKIAKRHKLSNLTISVSIED